MKTKSMDTDKTSHQDLHSEHGTEDFDDLEFEMAIRQARREEVLELEQLNW